MHHLLVGRVAEVRRREYTDKDGGERCEVVVTVSAGSESCQTSGEDDDYHYDEKVILKVKGRAVSFKTGAFINYQRLEKMEGRELASDLSVFTEGT